MFKIPFALSDNFYKYTLNWTPDFYEWKFNDFSLRKLFKNKTSSYPDSPSKLQFGIWQAPPSPWAGNGIQWTEPFVFYISSLKINCNNVLPTTTTDISTTIDIPTTTTNIPTTTTDIQMVITDTPTTTATSISRCPPKTPVYTISSDAISVTLGYTLFFTLLYTLLL